MSTGSTLYDLTPPHGYVPADLPIDGVCGISEALDRVGLMRRDPRDLASSSKILLEKAYLKHQDDPPESGTPGSKSLESRETFVYWRLDQRVMDGSQGQSRRELDPI